MGDSHPGCHGAEMSMSGNSLFCDVKREVHVVSMVTNLSVLRQSLVCE